MCQAAHILQKQLSRTLLFPLLEVRNVSGKACPSLMATCVAAGPHCSWPDPFLPIARVSVQGFQNPGTLQTPCVGSCHLKLRGVPFICSYVYLYIVWGSVTDSWRRIRESKERMEKDVVRCLHNAALNWKRPRPWGSILPLGTQPTQVGRCVL